MNAEKTISVPEAGRRYFNIGKDSSYAAARCGEIPTIRVGGLLRVPVCQMERRLEEPVTKKQTPDDGLEDA